MLTYLVNVTEDLVSTAILCALALAYARVAWPKTGTRAVGAGVICALVASAVMAFMKQTTNMVDTGLWNMRIFAVAFVALVVFLLCFIRPIAKSKAGSAIMQAALALFVFCRVFYKVPDVYLYPFNFNLSGESVLSTDFAMRIVGYLAGLLVIVLAGAALAKCVKALGRKWVGVSVAVVASILGVLQMMTGLQTMLARHIIKNNPVMFNAVKFFSNNGTAFMFVIVAIALAFGIAVIVLSLRDAEPYDNPAQHRKIRARWRNRRRWAFCLIACLVVSLCVVTVVKDYDSRGPEIVEAEEIHIEDGKLRVALEDVDDGHLHRFVYNTTAGVTTSSGYTTGGNVGVRFIVIKKPGASTYGVGLDACEICGETGYYERDGQVVCKLCDVVMNINTIGFKGGCNPIPFEYSVENGYIVVDPLELAQYEKTFKS